MRIEKKYALHFILTATALSIAFYFLLQMVCKDTVQINCKIKSFRNADLEMFYNSKAPDFGVDNSHKSLLTASPFFKTVPFLIPDAEQTHFLRLDLGDDENTILVSGIELIIRSMSQKNTIKKWNAPEIRQLIRSYNDVVLETETATYLQFKAGKDDPYLIFNDAIFKELESLHPPKRSDEVIVILTSLVLGLFFTITFIFLFPLPKREKLIHNMRRGSVLITGAVAIIFLVFFNNWWGFLPDIKNKEKRKLTEKPALNSNSFFEYPDMFSDYARDNFSFRNALFFLNANMKASLFHQSPLPGDVIMGKNDWLFDNEAGCINDFRNMAQISPDEMGAIAVNMTEKKAWLAKRNIRFYVMVAPNKHRVYPQLMPSYLFPVPNTGQNRLDFYKAHLKIHGGIDLIDPTDSLKSAGKRHEVYYSSDTHWNLYGGFKGYQVLMNEIKKDFPMVQPLKEDEFIMTNVFTSEGDLAAMIGLQEKFKRKEYLLTFLDTSKHLPRIDRSDVKLEYRNNKTVDNSQLKLLMFRDSYANYLMPFLNLHFKDAVYIWSYEFLDQLIEEEKPDVVIFESLQRFMPVAFLTPNPETVYKSK